MNETKTSMKDAELTLNNIKFGKLREEHLIIYRDGNNLRVVHEPTGISVEADSRDSLRENWEIAQQAINSALEHQESVGNDQPEQKGHW